VSAADISITYNKYIDSINAIEMAKFKDNTFVALGKSSKVNTIEKYSKDGDIVWQKNMLTLLKDDGYVVDSLATINLNKILTNKNNDIVLYGSVKFNCPHWHDGELPYSTYDYSELVIRLNQDGKILSVNNYKDNYALCGLYDYGSYTVESSNIIESSSGDYISVYLGNEGKTYLSRYNSNIERVDNKMTSYKIEVGAPIVDTTENLGYESYLMQTLNALILYSKNLSPSDIYATSDIYLTDKIKMEKSSDNYLLWLDKNYKFTKYDLKQEKVIFSISVGGPYGNVVELSGGDFVYIGNGGLGVYLKLYDSNGKEIASAWNKSYDDAAYANSILEIDGNIIATLNHYAIVFSGYPTVENNPESKAVFVAENDPTLENINNARILINAMPESVEKDQLQARLNALMVSDLSLIPEKNTSNMDIYVSSNSSLSLSLVNSSVTFDDFSGVEDLSISNALSFTINSSNNYNVSTSLVGNIVSSKGNILDKSIFNLRASGDTAYKNYVSSNTLDLFTNQTAGNNKTHKIDMILKGNVAHTADVYKAVLKVVVEQV
jgi:hypothetical protein